MIGVTVVVVVVPLDLTFTGMGRCRRGSIRIIAGAACYGGTAAIKTSTASSAAGASDIIVPNLPPLGLVPRFKGSPCVSAQVSAAASGFDQALAAGLATLPAANPGKTLHIFQLDNYTLFDTLVGLCVRLATTNTGTSRESPEIVTAAVGSLAELSII